MMSVLDKTLLKMANNPLGWKIADIELIARQFGINIRKSGGSHVTFSHPSLQLILTVPAHKPVKPIYIKKFLKMLEDLES